MDLATVYRELSISLAVRVAHGKAGQESRETLFFLLTFFVLFDFSLLILLFFS